MAPSIFATHPPIRFEGPQSSNPLCYHWYDADRLVAGKRMEDHLRFAVCFWHSFSWPGSDVFGAGTLQRPWLAAPVTHEAALQRLEAGFDFIERLGVPFFTFHDVDVAADAQTVQGVADNLARILDPMEAAMARTGKKLLWGTANLFSHPRYAAGAATAPDPAIVACAAVQVKAALEATHRLGGANYVLWGGREGYDTLLNTNLAQELDQYGRFLAMVVSHKHKIGFKGTILIEPKPHEPTKHQYDRDVATVYAFLQRYGLEREVKVNIEANHATLAGLTFEHEIEAALAYGIFGSIDMNRGDPQNGWDTDQFPNSVTEMALALAPLLQKGGFTTGGINFDAKLRRQSTAVDDLFLAHIAGIDTVARGLLIAEAMLANGTLSTPKAERYAAWNSDLGRSILSGTADLDSLAALGAGQPETLRPPSGRQEMLENAVNRASWTL